jgi:drug/metabolite transporter (DMT)-like permease
VARTSRRSGRTGVDPRDEPSVRWGWHGSFPNATRVAGVIVAIVLLLMVIGPYQSHLQDWWIVGIALLILAAIVRGTMKRRAAWRK